MTTTIRNQEVQLSRELRAVVEIFGYDACLREKALANVDFERESIDWQGIWENDFSGGHAAAVIWAQALWRDQIETKSDPFDRAFAMDAGLRAAVLRALAIKWELTKPW